MAGKKIRTVYYFLLRNFNKCILRIKGLPNYKQEDITVVIGVKNRCGYRLENSLKSIRNQDYPQDLIKIILVDYDSKESLIPEYKKICLEYIVDYIRVDNKLKWNRSQSLNIGIKRAKTKYTLTSDVDIIFEKNYIKESIKELQKNPFQVILSKCLDLPNQSPKKADYNKLKSLAKFRFEKDYLSQGINLTLTYFYHIIRGYDEQYLLYGREDEDLIKRFALYGLSLKDVGKKTSYLHQWHPKFEEKTKGFEKQIAKNIEYYENNNSIVRNKEGWGRLNRYSSYEGLVQSPSIEITTRIGCRNLCKYCPQDKLIRAYKKRSNVFEMSFATFKKCLDKIPLNVRIDFSGMSEPWLNSECTKMILYAHKSGFKIAVYTTLIGMSLSDVDLIKSIPFDYFVVHLPDNKNNTKIKINDTYLNVLKKISVSIPTVRYRHYSGIHKKLKPLIKKDKLMEGHLITRAGNINIKNRKTTILRGTIRCMRNLTHNILLPNGDVVLCCMDYGLKHTLGNLIFSDYSSLFNSKEFMKVKKGLNNDSLNILCRRCDYFAEKI